SAVIWRTIRRTRERGAARAPPLNPCHSRTPRPGLCPFPRGTCARHGLARLGCASPDRVIVLESTRVSNVRKVLPDTEGSACPSSLDLGGNIGEAQHYVRARC